MKQRWRMNEKKTHNNKNSNKIKYVKYKYLDETIKLKAESEHTYSVETNVINGNDMFGATFIFFLLFIFGDFDQYFVSPHFMTRLLFCWNWCHS